jgi:CMP/dCMP kinase
MTIITISRQAASGGDEITLGLCRELEYRLFDKTILAAAAREEGIAEKDVFDFSDDSYQVRSFLDRIFGRMAVLPYGGFMSDDLYALYLAEEAKYHEEDHVKLVEKAVRFGCDLGNMVILGRGGQVILKDHPGVIHIRIEAPLADRIQRMMQEIKAENEGQESGKLIRSAAQESILQKDESSRDYLKHFYHVNWADPLLYHLVINTGKMSIAQAVKTITGLVHAAQPA